MLKKFLRRMFPALYDSAWRLKEFLRMGTFKKQWEKYYVARYPWLLEPDPVVVDLKLPAHINRILDVGCGSGRNFIPFDGKLKLWGIDLVREKQIKWVRPFKDLTYEHLTVEQMTRRLESDPIDLSHTLVFESGTLMYVSEEYQNRFFEACKRRGCKNFLFIDYRPGKPDGLHLKIPESNFPVVYKNPDLSTYVYKLMEAA